MPRLQPIQRTLQPANAGTGAGGSSGPRSRRRLQGQASPGQSAKLLGGTDEAGQERLGGGRNGGSTRHIPCKFYKHGNCTAGSECSFSHDINLFVEKAVCKYYVKGNCKYGNRCALLHTTSGDASAAAGQSRQRPSASSDDSSRSESGSSENAQNDSGDKQQTPKPSDAATTASRSSTSVNSASTARRTSPPSTLGSGPASRQPIPSKDRPLANGNLPSSTGQQNKAAVSVASSDSDSVSKKQPNAWATGSLTNSALRNKGQAPKKPTLDLSASLGAAQGLYQKPEHAEDDSFANSIFSSQAKDSAVSPFKTHFESVQNNATFDGDAYPRPQPIPKPSTGFSRPGKGGISALAQSGGLSLQDSLRIDKLALSHGAARQSFGGPSFTSGSIPMLDHFGEHSRSDAGFSPGTTPLAHSFVRSPPTMSSSMMLAGRHAFTAVDSSNSALGTPEAEYGSGSLRGLYHNHLQGHMNATPIRSSGDGGRSNQFDMSPALNPIGSARSIPRSNELFGRPLRSSSFMNEPASPRSSFAYAPDFSESSILGANHGSPLGNSAGELSGTTGRLRSNSYIPSPSLMGLSMGMDIRGSKNDSGIGAHSSFHDSPFLLKEGRLGGYPLTDISSMSYDRTQAPSGGIWDSLNSNFGHEASRDHELRSSFGLPIGGQSLGTPRAGGGSFAQPIGSYGGQYGSASQNWAHSPRASMQTSVHGSPFMSAVGSFGEHRQMTLPPIGSVSSHTDGLRSGAIGQRSFKPQHFANDMPMGLSDGFSNSGQLGTAFRATAPTLTTMNGTGHASNGSGGRSSAASDNYGEMFELEQDAATPPRTIGSNGAAPNPSFISMEGFSRKFSGISLSQTEAAAGGAGTAHAASSGQSIPNVSAISRPST
ncbi:hypothetical protein H4218_004124 [Coemansia sp. IMI 209128]|nr:hypothetical protein H4218_004124 [Coemansia sp. IMI 209128]